MLDSSKLEEVADDNFKFDENCRKFFKWVEKNTVGKGEIACYEQFLLFQHSFQKTSTDTEKPGLVRERIHGSRPETISRLYYR